MSTARLSTKKVWVYEMNSGTFNNPNYVFEIFCDRPPTLEEIKKIWDAQNHGVPLDLSDKPTGHRVVKTDSYEMMHLYD